jgi:hypothetical protein
MEQPILIHTIRYGRGYGLYQLSPDTNPFYGGLSIILFRSEAPSAKEAFNVLSFALYAIKKKKLSCIFSWNVTGQIEYGLGPVWALNLTPITGVSLSDLFTAWKPLKRTSYVTFPPLPTVSGLLAIRWCLKILS